MPCSKKRTVKLHQHLYSFIKVCMSMLKKVSLEFFTCVLHSNAYKNMCEIFFDVVLLCMYEEKREKLFFLEPIKTRSFHDFLKIFRFTQKIFLHTPL